MRDGKLGLVVAALLGGVSVHLALEACGRVTSLHDAATADGLVAGTAVITEWQSYMPTLNARVSGAVVANQSSKGMWRRVGDTVEVRIDTVFSAAPSGGGTCPDFWVWSLPAGLTPDTAKQAGVAGSGTAYLPGSRNAKLHPFSFGGGVAAEGDADCYVNSMSPFAFGPNSAVSLAAAIPIAGWTATQ
jgi:hypothetical protein